MTAVTFDMQMRELKRFFLHTEHDILDRIFDAPGEIAEQHLDEERVFERLGAPGFQFPFKVFHQFDNRMLITDRKEFAVGRHVIVVAIAKKLGNDGQPMESRSNGAYILVYTPSAKRLVYVTFYGHARNLNDLLLLMER